MRTWLKVTAHLPSPPEDWSPWIEVFSECGLEGTVQVDSPPSLSSYVAPGAEGSIVPLREALERRGARVETEDVVETDWAEAWKQFFKPVQIGEKFLIRPTWEPAIPLEGRHEIVLDPGQAFGTGDHPTTRMCLAALEQSPIEGVDVADIGCGSGILSIGAALLGAQRVCAVDVDPLSIESTRTNADRNGVKIEAYEGAGFEPLGEQMFQVVVSNIISAAIIAIAPEAAKRVEQGGVWIVSGIIRDNWPDVEKATMRNGFTTVNYMEEGEWVAASLVR